MSSPNDPASNSTLAGENEMAERSGEGDEKIDDKERKNAVPAIDRTLVTYKIFYLLFFAGFGSTFPYLTIYFKQMGLNASHVGTLSGIRPLVQFVSGPLWAYLADKYRSRKLVLSMSIFAWLVMTLALAFPQPRNTTCQHINTTSLTKRDIHPAFAYPSLPLSPLPAVTQEIRSTKKSAVNSSNTESDVERSVDVIVYDKEELGYLFYIFLVLIVVGEFFEAPSFVMIDTALIHQLGDNSHDYGKTRMFGSIGYGLAAFGVGAVLDTTRYVYCGHEMNNYMTVFYFFVVFMIIGLIFAMTLFKFKYNDDASCTSSSIFAVYKLCFSVKYASFLFTVWFMGIGNGGQVTFVNWFLEDLGASKLMMGLTTVIRSSAVITGFFFSGAVINRLGEVPTVFLSLVVFSVVYFGYSFLVNPWLVIPLEILQGSVYAISWSTCIVYLSAVTPDNGAATMQSKYSINIFICKGIYILSGKQT